MVNQKVETSRERILRAARAEFAERGFEGARVAKVAQLAGVNKQLLFYYFGSKAGLYAAVVSDAVAELTAALRLENSASPVASPFGISHPPEPTAAERLRAAAQKALGVLGESDHLVRLLMLDALRAGGPRPETKELLESLAMLFRKLLSDGQGLGFFRDDMDPQLASVQIMVSLLGFLGFQPALPPGIRNQQDRWLETSAGLWVRGLGW